MERIFKLPVAVERFASGCLLKSCGSTFFRIPDLNEGNMKETITAIDTIALCIPQDIWALSPMLKMSRARMWKAFMSV